MTFFKWEEKVVESGLEKRVLDVVRVPAKVAAVHLRPVGVSDDPAANVVCVVRVVGVESVIDVVDVGGPVAVAECHC